MDDKELALLVAKGHGPETVAAVERELRGERDTRAFGFAEAGFIIACASFAFDIWKARQDRALLVLALAEGLDGRYELASRLDPEKRLGVIASVVNALIPERFGSSPSLPAEKPRSKQQWISTWAGYGEDWVGYGDKTRAMSSPVLLPFADMDNYIVFKPIHWTPPPEAPSNLPRMITVPTGFVTDLATIPSYFWWAITPTGRHGHAAILHDWLYWKQGCPRAVADRVFEVAMAELEVDLPVRKAMWAAVRVGGGEYWAEATEEKRLGKNRILKRMPETPVTWDVWRQNPDVFEPLQ